MFGHSSFSELPFSTFTAVIVNGEIFYFDASITTTYSFIVYR